jgi:hypothetical protein
MPTLQITIPTKWDLHAKTVLAVLGAMPRVQGFKTVFHVADRVSNLDQMRSALLTQWYDAASDDDAFLFVDSDQTLTGDDLNALLAKPADVVIGVVGVGGNAVNVLPVNPAAFPRDDALIAGGAGVMLIRRPILHRVKQVVAELHGRERFQVPRSGGVIPFFLQRIVEREGAEPEWLAEDSSFCWLVRRAGGSIRAVVSPTIGHEVMRLEYVEAVRPR